MLNAAESLDVGITAVVVGDEKALVGNHFACASSSELHDGILEGYSVGIVDLFRGEFASHLLHFLCVHFFEPLEQPHSFICLQAERGACQKCRHERQR